MKAPSSPDEAKRVDALKHYAIMDTPAQSAYDDIVLLACAVCDTPIALISLLDASRQWFKAKAGLDVLQTPLDDAFCAHAVVDPEGLMVVPDTLLDPRFQDNPWVTAEPSIRFYAGAPLVTPTGVRLGAVCVMDRVPRRLDARSCDALKALSRQVVALLEWRRSEFQLRTLSDEQRLRQIQLDGYQKRLESVNQLLLAQSTVDPLTGLKNRRAFDEVLCEELARTERNGMSVALILVDVDHFERFNEEFGQLAGDETLRLVAVLLSSQARPYDLVARYGGEALTLTLILPDTGMDASLMVAERVRLAIEGFVWPLRPITVSLGVAVSSATTRAASLVARADRALCQAKQNGRNCVVFFGEDD